MPPKKDKKKKIKKPAKKSAVSQSQNITVNISKGTRGPKKASLIQNMPLRPSPSIFNPAPTPFQISAPQPTPFSSANEIAQELRRLARTDIATAFQERDIIGGPRTALPTGSFVTSPQFNNMEVPNSFTELERELEREIATPMRRGVNISIEEQKKAIRLTLDKAGIPYKMKDSLPKLKEKLSVGRVGGAKRQVPTVSEDL
jgi:hypothetical protein